jgi:hypothetical protein
MPMNGTASPRKSLVNSGERATRPILDGVLGAPVE